MREIGEIELPDGNCGVLPAALSLPSADCERWGLNDDTRGFTRRLIGEADDAWRRILAFFHDHLEAPARS